MPRPLSREEIVEIVRGEVPAMIASALEDANLGTLYESLMREHNLPARSHRKGLAQYVAWENIVGVPKECFRCYLTADQDNIADNTVTTIQFTPSGINYDSEGKGLAGYGYVVSVAGIYSVKLNVNWNDVVADKIYACYIYRNSTKMGGGASHTSSGTAQTSCRTTDEFHCDEGDIIYGKAQHVSGAATPDISGGSRDETYMVIRRVRPKLITEEL